MSILTLLKEDHAEVKELFETVKKTTPKASKRRAQLLEKIKNELVLHEKIEEVLFYPPLLEHAESKSKTLEAYEEHHVANLILAELNELDPEAENWLAKITVLNENLLHHIKEEEKIIFPLAKKIFSKQELEEMGEEMKRMKRQK